MVYKGDTLFGEPNYETLNFEEAYSYILFVEPDSSEKIYLEVYEGSSGPAIGGLNNAERLQAAETLKKLIEESEEVADYQYIDSVNYSDESTFQIFCGFAIYDPTVSKDKLHEWCMYTRLSIGNKGINKAGNLKVNHALWLDYKYKDKNAMYIEKCTRAVR